MSDASPGDNRKIEIRKYPNRRYYDVSHSQHVTLEDILQLVRDGHDIRVTDSKSGDDITARVLTQIILEHDSPKLGVFPIELLHGIIRANEPLMRDFVEKYFSQAFLAFTESQKQFDQYLRKAVGLEFPAAGSDQWSNSMFGPFAHPFFASGPQHQPSENDEEGSSAERGELKEMVEDLQEQVRALQEELQQR